MGQSPSSSNYSENEDDTILIQGNADLINGKVVPRIYTSEITKISKPGDIILTVRAPVGDLAINEFNSCIGRGVCSIEGNKFIYYFLQSLKNKHVWERLSQGSTFESINSNDIKNLNVKIPSKKIQKSISSFLTIIDNKIELLEKKYSQYQDFKKYLMQQIFTQKLRFDFNIIKLNDICDINKGKQLNKENMVNFGEYYVLNGGKEPSGYTNSWNTPANTITISEGGNSCGYVNFNEEKFWSGGHCYYLSNLSSKIDLYYLYSYLKFIEPSIMRLRVGSGLPNIQKGDIENIKVKTLPINEQIKIRNVLRIIDKKISTLKVQKEHFEVFKKGLLQQMFV